MMPLRKCLVWSAALHVLPVAILLIGPAFLPSRPVPADLPILDLIPANLIPTDELVFGGGGAPPRAARLPKPVVPPPAETRASSPPRTESKPPNPALAPTAPLADPREMRVIDPEQTKPKHEVKVNLTPAQRNGRKTNPAALSRSQIRAEREAWQQQVNDLIGDVSQNLSHRTVIEPMDSGGFGGSGPAYANYQQIIKSIYDHRWIDPEGVNDLSLTARVKVVIDRDGQVVVDEIVQPSGNAVFDRSVQQTLEKVRLVPPFPEGAKENQRVYYFNFRLRDKRSIVG